MGQRTNSPGEQPGRLDRDAAHDAPHTSQYDTRLTRARYSELLKAVDSQRRQLGLENHLQHRAADIGRDGPELGL
jgi:hypothetical protein